jgi:alanine dehydrogenase
MHYAVSNMPALVPRTSTFALTNATLPYALRLARGVDAALGADPGCAKGLNTVDGNLVHAAVAAAQAGTDRGREAP